MALSSMVQYYLKVCKKELDLRIMAEPGTPFGVGPEGENENAEKREGNVEYDFEAGVDAAVERTNDILSEQDYAVVSINGPEAHDADVGKTAFFHELGKRLTEERIPFHAVPDADFIDITVKDNLKINQYLYHSNKAVLIFKTAGSVWAEQRGKNKTDELKREVDAGIESRSRRAGLPFRKVDVRVLIYRADRPPSREEREQSADIVVRNDYATDKLQ